MGVLKGKLDDLRHGLASAEALAESTGQSLTEARAQQQALKAEAALAASNRQKALTGLIEARASGNSKLAAFAADKVAEYEVQLSRLDSQLRPLANQIRTLSDQNAGALAKIKALAGNQTLRKVMSGLASAGGVVVEMMNLSSTADTISNEVDRAAIELSEKYERTEEARKAYLAAEDERSEEHTSELQSLMRHSYAVFCLKKKTK